MKLAYSTNAFTRTDLDSALNHIADLGFSGAEILCDSPHWFPGKVSDKDIDDIIKILHERNIQVSNLNVNTANGYYHPRPPENVFEPALSNTNIELRQWRQNYTIEAIRLAKKIGAHCVSVTSGHPSPGCAPERSLDIFVDSLKHICDAAEKHDIKVGIEYEDAYLVIVQISDEEDQSPDYVSNYVNHLKSLKSDPRKVVVHSIVSTTDQPGDASAGTRYMAMSNALNGTVSNIQNNFHDILKNMGGTILNLLDSFPLSQKPFENSVQVFVNGSRVNSGWTYNTTTNSIRFIAGQEPSEGANIKFQYTVEVK